MAPQLQAPSRQGGTRPTPRLGACRAAATRAAGVARAGAWWPARRPRPEPRALPLRTLYYLFRRIRPVSFTYLLISSLSDEICCTKAVRGLGYSVGGGPGGRFRLLKTVAVRRTGGARVPRHRQSNIMIKRAMREIFDRSFSALFSSSPPRSRRASCHRPAADRRPPNRAHTQRATIATRTSVPYSALAPLASLRAGPLTAMQSRAAQPQV